MKKNGKEIVFTKDYADKKEGDNYTCDSMIASRLVNNLKVAKYKTVAKTKKKTVKNKEQ